MRELRHLSLTDDPYLQCTLTAAPQVLAHNRFFIRMPGLRHDGKMHRDTEIEVRIEIHFTLVTKHGDHFIMQSRCIEFFCVFLPLYCTLFNGSVPEQQVLGGTNAPKAATNLMRGSKQPLYKQTLPRLASRKVRYFSRGKRDSSAHSPITLQYVPGTAEKIYRTLVHKVGKASEV